MSDDDLNTQRGDALTEVFVEAARKVDAAKERNASPREILDLTLAATDKLRLILDQMPEEDARELRKKIPPWAQVWLDRRRSDMGYPVDR
jgi:hypothetical protein